MQNRIFPGLAQRNGDRPATLRWAARVSGGRMARRDALLEVRWEKVRALRAAIAGGTYDLDGRLDDLLEDPPLELAARAPRITISIPPGR